MKQKQRVLHDRSNTKETSHAYSCGGTSVHKCCGWKNKESTRPCAAPRTAAKVGKDTQLKAKEAVKEKVKVTRSEKKKKRKQSKQSNVGRKVKKTGKKATTGGRGAARGIERQAGG